MTRKATAEQPLWESFKRQSIQQAVVQIMCREGLEAVTMERVAHEAGIAKGTVYLHYRDKQELLDEVKESALAPLMSKLEEIFRSDATADRKLEVYSHRYLAYFDERSDLFRILLYEREVTRVQGMRYQSPRYLAMVDGITHVIEDGVASGIFRDVTDARAIAAMFVESNFAILSQRLLTERPRPFEDDAQLISDLFIQGLRSEKTKGRRSPR